MKELEKLDDNIQVFTQFEAYMLAYAVIGELKPKMKFEKATALIDDLVPRVLRYKDVYPS